MCIQTGMGNLPDGSLYDPGQNRLSHPAQTQTSKRDSKLNPIDDLVQVAMKFQNGTGTNPAGFNQLLNASVAQADECEFCGGEEGVGRYQQQDDEHPKQ